MTDSLQGRTVVVTGAAHGIGAATARLLVQAGAQVIALDLHKPTAAGLDALPYVPVDMGDAASIDAALVQLPAQVHGLCNIAGVPGTRSAQVTMAINYLGLRHLTDRLLPRMPAGSSVVNLASVAGNQWPERLAAHRELAAAASFEAGRVWLADHPPAGDTAYAYSKEALIVWTMVRAGALHREHGVRMNCVSPGPVDTAILEDFRNTLGREKVARAIELMGRPGLPDDIAPVVAFLCGPASAWIAGENIRVDAALTATRVTA
jgi:NAD(P)-dependent dehydrogenase (short-subunit alcohol dehydrogenase family)